MIGLGLGLPTHDEDVVSLVGPLDATLGTTGRRAGCSGPGPDAADDRGEVVSVEGRVAGEDVGVGQRDDWPATRLPDGKI